MNPSPFIEARNLTKAFRGGVVAVSGLDLAVPGGSVSGLIGRDGAGKTTTLRLLLGLLRPDQGESRVLGMSLWEAPHELRQRVAYVSESQQLPGWMTLDELCRSNASFYARWDADLGRGLARHWELPLKRPIAHLSQGEQRQSSILLALATKPEVLFLDQPAAGMDPIARRELLASLVDSRSQQDGCTIMFSAHYIGDLERIAEHVAMMDRGRIMRSLRLDEWIQSTKRLQGSSTATPFHPGSPSLERAVREPTALFSPLSCMNKRRSIGPRTRHSRRTRPRFCNESRRNLYRPAAASAGSRARAV